MTDSGQPTTGSQSMLCTNGSFSPSGSSCSTTSPIVTFSWLFGSWMGVPLSPLNSGGVHFNTTFTWTLDLKENWCSSGSYAGSTTDSNASCYGLMGGVPWKGAAAPTLNNQNITVCLGTGSVGTVSTVGVFSYDASTNLCDLTSLGNLGWKFAPGNYGTATLTTQLVTKHDVTYSGGGNVSYNPVAPNGVTYSGSWSGSEGSRGSIFGTASNSRTGTVSYTDSGGTLILNQNIQWYSNP